MNSDVAAFASRAKVVYPINQKYRVSLTRICCISPQPHTHLHTSYTMQLKIMNIPTGIVDFLCFYEVQIF